MKIGIRAWIDFAFKKIFGKPGNEICLISLLNAVLDLPQSIVSVEFTNPFSIKEFEEDKLVCVDVKATDANQRVFIVEVQVVVSDSFGKRALYYATKAYSDQLVAGQSYGDLKATYSVSILMQPLFHDDRLHHSFRLVEKETGMVMEDAIEIHTVELSKYNGDSHSLAGASVLEQWCYWIKNSHDHTEEELRALLPGLEFLHATRELTEIHEVTEERQVYDSREKAKLDLLSALHDARKEGIEQGIERGIEKGVLVGRLLNLQDILLEHHGTKEELAEWSSDRLNELLASLQAKLRNRMN